MNTYIGKFLAQNCFLVYLGAVVDSGEEPRDKVPLICLSVQNVTQAAGPATIAGLKFLAKYLN